MDPQLDLFGGAIHFLHYAFLVDDPPVAGLVLGNGSDAVGIQGGAVSFPVVEAGGAVGGRVVFIDAGAVADEPEVTEAVFFYVGDESDELAMGNVNGT